MFKTTSGVFDQSKLLLYSRLTFLIKYLKLNNKLEKIMSTTQESFKKPFAIEQSIADPLNSPIAKPGDLVSFNHMDKVLVGEVIENKSPFAKDRKFLSVRGYDGIVYNIPSHAIRHYNSSVVDEPVLDSEENSLKQQ